jgi:hypothetical protein
MTAVWVLLEALRQHEWRAFALAPARAWQGSWQQVTGPGAAGRGQRPLLIVLDCKGGGDARVKAGRTWRLHGAGARRVAIWPDEARLSLWDLPPADLAVLLFQMKASRAATAPPTRPASPARSCWPPTTTAACPAGCRCRTSTSAAGRLATASTQAN